MPGSNCIGVAVKLLSIWGSVFSAIISGRFYRISVVSPIKISLSQMFDRRFADKSIFLHFANE